MASKKLSKGPAPKKPSAKRIAVAPPAVLNAAASYAGIEIKPPTYEPAVAKASLDAWRPRLAAIPADALLIPRLDVRAAALAALGVHAFVTQVDAIKARFKKQHEAGEFTFSHINDLRTASFLVLYAHSQAETAGAFETGAKVPAALLKEATTLEARMQELCEYKFRRDPEIAPLLSLLSPGTGHRDLAADLLGYADIFNMRPAETASDTTNFKPTDADDARRIAGEILGHLSASMSPKARDSFDLLRRAWTLLLQIYFEIQKAGLYLLRYDPRRNEWFPSLFAAGRSGRPRKKKDEGIGKDETSTTEPPAG